MAKEHLPIVALVGRTNVGKSTLFNRIADRGRSIVSAEEHVTRDPIKSVLTWAGATFRLVDTGGVSLRKTNDPILSATRERALATIDEAAVVLFVCDSSVGLVDEDREIGRLLHQHKRPTIVVANKIDTRDSLEHVGEFDRLGFDTVTQVSAVHGTGVSELLDAIVQKVGDGAERPEPAAPAFNVSIIGRPNAGKSSLMNLLLKQERSIVADQPGTTREAVRERLMMHQEPLELTDTPGVRRKRGVTDPLETMMVKSSLRALAESDIVLLVVDATEGGLVDQELKLAYYAFEERHKAVIVLINKWDLADDYAKERLKAQIEEHKHFFKKVPRLNISCKTGERVGKILSLVNTVWQRYNQEFDTLELTHLFQTALQKKPLIARGSCSKCAVYARRVPRQLRSASRSITLDFSGQHSLAILRTPSGVLTSWSACQLFLTPIPEYLRISYYYIPTPRLVGHYRLEIGRFFVPMFPSFVEHSGFCKLIYEMEQNVGRAQSGISGYFLEVCDEENHKNVCALGSACRW